MCNQHEVEIIAFSEELSEPIKTLNYEWLEKYFRVEEGDVASLSNPQKYIIDKGGHIYYAKLNDEIVGTASLLKKSETVYELGKMAVNDKAQGQGIGTILLEHCLNVAKQSIRLTKYMLPEPDECKTFAAKQSETTYEMQETN